MITDKNTVHEINNIRSLVKNGIGFAVQYCKDFDCIITDHKGKKQTARKHIQNLVDNIDKRLERLIK